ncbi:unnamed protein product [Owenia fusiformis]|uniref:Uncharacterized protein n=1 Tax=Owenia fusiformis TaxID=6347 RepID=A0A8J1TUY2_OWEFU|nr:unnamed protein product [Owenia fusiformis]
MADESNDGGKLTEAQKARIERNKQKALSLRQSRVTTQPYNVPKSTGASRGTKQSFKASNITVDTHGGFMLDEELEQEIFKVVKPSAPAGLGDVMLCDECHKQYIESYMYTHFSVNVCDGCRDRDDKHKLITKTDGRNTYLLKDEDFDKREPPLKFIIRKNPHNPRWGEMKLYLESEVRKRALEVWGSEEKIEEARETRMENQQKLKQKKFDKKVKDLRNAVRSSLWTKDISTHEHSYGEETYDEEEDMYSKSCTSCSHTLTYEKM